MPSIWCPKCKYNKQRNEKCHKCGHCEESKGKSYPIPKYKKPRIIHGTKNKKIKKSITEKNIIIGMLAIIAIAISILTYYKITETDRQLEFWFGSNDEEEIIKNIEDLGEETAKQIKESEKESLKAIESFINKKL